MAQMNLSVYIVFLFALCFHHYHSVLSRSLSPSESSENPQYSTTIFDVAASIQRTLDVLSFDPQFSIEHTDSFQSQEQEKLTMNQSSSSFSMTLHPRSSLHKPFHKDYEALTLSRLERDSARVNSIAAKLELALNGDDMSKLKPVETTETMKTTSLSVQPEDLQSPVTSGESQGSGEYFSRVGVGRPAREYYMVLDTGSDVSWLQCSPCFNCYQQSDPIFDPSESSTYRPVPCVSPQCNALQVSACRFTSCLYQVSYGDGSFTVGDFATESLSFGRSGSVNNVAIGCGHDNEGLFTAAAGLFGLGGGSVSLPSQLKSTAFSYCLVDRDSSQSSTLEFNSGRPRDSVTAALLRNSRYGTFYYVALTGISVGGRPLALSPSVFAVDDSGRGGIIVDSGTAVTRLKSEAYNALRDEFVRLTRNLPSAGGYSIFDTCYDLSSFKSVDVPTVAFRFANQKTLTLQAKNYLIPVDSNGKVCLAFAPTSGPLSIIGNIQQQGTRVSFDLAHSVVGFSPNKC